MTTAADLMTAEVPRASADRTVADALATLRQRSWEEVGHVYLVDDRERLIGQVSMERLLFADSTSRLSTLRGDPPVEVQPDDNAETVALQAVERHEADVAVVDRQQHFLGAIPIGRLLSILHEEHVDNFLRMGGVSDVHPKPLAKQSTIMAFRARIPWLAIGLVGGFFAGGVAAFFEVALKQEIALAFFLPLVVYMADAVGTQTETILVRALAYGNVPVGAQLLREGLVGSLIGGAIGLLAGLGLWIWDGRPAVALVVALTLAVTAVIATLVASMLPLGLARLGTDPALASGPVATVLQDILSVAIYLSIATVILHW
jgi:magnesium transporter